MIKQLIAFLLTLCLIITQSTHAYTLTWLPHQPAKHSATVGSSQSHSDSTQTSTRNSGSTVKAGGNLNLTATAAKGEGGNITIQGSDIKAGRDISLDASNNINLLAAQDTSSQVSHNSSSSSGAGVSISKAGPGITANASKANGNSDGHDVTNIATTLNAGNKLTLKSGKDTNLIGATANGKQVVANVGGDLNIASVQDTSTYTSKQESISASGTIGAGGSANLNASQQKINGNYASVKTQSGLKAGDGGFQVTVKGNTDLKGGVIASTDKAVANNSNTFTTATLTQSDLTNVATYDAQSLSVGVGTNGVTPPMALNAKDKDSSVTRSGISGANVSITNTEKQKQLTGKDSADTIASINRDVATDKDTSGAINNNLNVQEIQTGFAVTQAFVQQANTFMSDMATKSERLKKAGDAKQTAADQEQDPAKKAKLLAEANDLHQQSQDSAAASEDWAPGKTNRQILTAITAAAGGNVTGGTNQLIQGAAVNYIQSLGAEQIKAMAPALGGEGSPAHTALHGILACGGASAQGANCDTAALGASTGVVINSLMAGDPSTMTAAELENRKNLVAILVTGIAAAAGSTEVSSATNAAVMETENNYLKKKPDAIPQKSEAEQYADAKAACSPSNPDACKVKKELEQRSLARDNLVAKACNEGAADCKQLLHEALNNDSSQIRTKDGKLVVTSPEYASMTAINPQENASVNSKHNQLSLNLSSGLLITGAGAVVASTTIGATAGVVDAAVTTSTSTKIIGGIIGGGATAGVQKIIELNKPVELQKPINLWDVGIGVVTGAGTIGARLLPSVIVNTDGAFVGAVIQGESPLPTMLGAGVGTVAGFPVGAVAGAGASRVIQNTNPFGSYWVDSASGMARTGVPSNVPLYVGTGVSSVTQEVVGAKVKDAVQSVLPQ